MRANEELIYLGTKGAIERRRVHAAGAHRRPRSSATRGNRWLDLAVLLGLAFAPLLSGAQDASWRPVDWSIEGMSHGDFEILADGSSIYFGDLIVRRDGTAPTAYGEFVEGSVEDLEVREDGVIWAVGKLPLALRSQDPTYAARSTDDGRTWERIDLPVEVELLSVFFLDPEFGVIGTEDPQLLVTTDGGDAWSTRPYLIDGEIKPRGFTGIRFLDRMNGWATAKTGRDSIYRTTDGGTNWITVPVPTSPSALKGADEDGCWITAQGSLYRVANDGASEPVNEGVAAFLRDLVVDGTELIAFYDDGSVHASPDRGATWTAQEPVPEDPLLVRFREGQWLIRGRHAFLRSFDQRASWEILQEGPISKARALAWSDPHQLWAVGAQGRLRHSRDGGVSWTGYTGFPDFDFTGVFFLDAAQGWIVGAQDVHRRVLLKTTDGGATWTEMTGFAGAGVPNGVVFTHPERGWIFDNNRMHYTTDGGVTWFGNLPFDSGGITDASWPTESDGFFLSAKQDPIDKRIQIYRTSDAGVSWSRLALPFDGVRSLHFVSPELGWLCSAYGLIAKTVDGGLTWSTQPTPDGHSLQRIRFSDLSTGYAIGGSGALLTTKDGGATWEIPEQFNTWPLRAEKWADVAISPEGLVAVAGESGLVVRDMSAWDQGKAPVLRSAPAVGEGLRWALPTHPGTLFWMETSEDLSTWRTLGSAFWSKGWYQSTPVATASEQPVFYRVVSLEPEEEEEEEEEE